jgi:hypothetical protein
MPKTRGSLPLFVEAMTSIIFRLSFFEMLAAKEPVLQTMFFHQIIKLIIKPFYFFKV